MQEDKEPVFDACDTLHMCLTTFIPMIKTMRVLPQNMRKAAAGGFINATDAADYLVEKGMPFRDAYRVVGELVGECVEKGTTLEALPLKNYQAHSELFDEGIYDAISLEKCVNGRTVLGGPAPQNVEKEAKRILAMV